MTEPATETIPPKKKKTSQRRVSREQLASAIEDACTWSVSGLDSDDAEGMADDVVDLVIATLRRELPRRSLAEWTLALADLRGKIADYLAREFDRCAADNDDLPDRILAELTSNE